MPSCLVVVTEKRQVVSRAGTIVGGVRRNTSTLDRRPGITGWLLHGGRSSTMTSGLTRSRISWRPSSDPDRLSSTSVVGLAGCWCPTFGQVSMWTGATFLRT